MLRCIGPRPRDLEPKVGVTSGKASKKGLTETGNRAWKVSDAIRGTELKHYPLFPDWTEPCPRPRDLEPKVGVTSGEASKKRTNRNRKPRMKSLCHSGYGTQALSFISTLNRTLERNLFSCHIFLPKWSQISLFFCLNDDWPSMPCFTVKVQMQSKQHINKRNVILPPLVYFRFSQG